MDLSQICENSVYDELEDADEFENPEEFVACSRCDAEYRLPDAPLTLCENCGSAWCYDCTPGGKFWNRSSEKERMGFQTDPPIGPLKDMDAQEIYEQDWHFDLLLTCPYCPRDTNGYVIVADTPPHNHFHESESAYDELEDADEFSSHKCSNPECEETNDFWLCNGCGSFWCDFCYNSHTDFGVIQRLSPDFEPGHVNYCPNCVAPEITESVYDELEDADEFEDEEIYCGNCGGTWHHQISCEKCGSPYCQTCLPGSRQWLESDPEWRSAFKTDPPHNLKMHWYVYDRILECPVCNLPYQQWQEQHRQQLNESEYDELEDADQFQQEYHEWYILDTLTLDGTGIIFYLDLDTNDISNMAISHTVAKSHLSQTSDDRSSLYHLGLFDLKTVAIILGISYIDSKVDHDATDLYLKVHDALWARFCKNQNNWNSQQLRIMQLWEITLDYHNAHRGFNPNRPPDWPL